MNFNPYHIPKCADEPYPASIHLTFIEPDDTTLTYTSAHGSVTLRFTDAQALALARAILENVHQTSNTLAVPVTEEGVARV